MHKWPFKGICSWDAHQCFPKNEIVGFKRPPGSVGAERIELRTIGLTEDPKGRVRWKKHAFTGQT